MIIIIVRILGSINENNRWNLGVIDMFLLIVSSSLARAVSAWLSVPTAHAQACSYLIIVRCFGRAGATLLVT